MILDLNDKQVLARLKANAAALLPEWGKAGTQWANDLDRAMVKRMSGRSGNDGLNVRSGNLRRNVRHFSRIRAGEGLVAGVSINAPYARKQEEGGEVRATKGKFLSIPIQGGPALTPAGVSRYASPREYPGVLQFIRTSRGKAYLIEEMHAQQKLTKSGRGGKITHAQTRLVYALVKSVRIPARLGLQKTGRAMVPDLERQLIAATERIFARAA